jgi:DMSO/TMAO reductase YedYZ molybdopterin-dependent catalytic subunit
MAATTTAVTAIREAITLPAATTVEPPLPAGATLDVEGISPLITPNADFYRIDIALQVPRIDPEEWSLRIHGLVDTEVSFSYRDILAMPLVEHRTTIACVSNEVGGDLIGTAAWLGVPIRDLLTQAGIRPEADMILSSGPDGFTAGSPVEFLTDPTREAMLAVGMNGEPLPIEHGFPARLIVPGLYGYVSATKWVRDLKATRFAQEEGYWTPRGWSAQGPIKTQSRIDTPPSGQAHSPGIVPIAGVAWAQHTGITAVEIRVDDGPWLDATLATALSTDTWVQWVYPWQATSGVHTLMVRATDASGYTQTSAVAPPAPDGATGWHSIVARVS